MIFLLFPLVLVPQFSEIGREIQNQTIGKLFIWLSVPFYIIVAWIFLIIERIGSTGENLGKETQCPIPTIARVIEIDLRQSLGESDGEIPKPYAIKLHI